MATIATGQEQAIFKLQETTRNLSELPQGDRTKVRKFRNSTKCSLFRCIRHCETYLVAS